MTRISRIRTVGDLIRLLQSVDPALPVAIWERGHQKDTALYSSNFTRDTLNLPEGKVFGVIILPPERE